MFMCLSPNYKNLKGERMFIPCGRCYECVRARKLGWEIRLNAANNWSDCSFFSLLTFDDEHYPVDDRDKAYHHDVIQHFIKRLRQRLNRFYNSGIKLKYFVASEFGEQKDRLHFHACFFVKGMRMTWHQFSTFIHSYTLYNYRTGKVSYMSPFNFNAGPHCCLP